MLKQHSSILLLAILFLSSAALASKLSLPKLQEPSFFGAGNPFIEGVSFTLGSTLSIYNGLMWVTTPQNRVDSCHRDYFNLVQGFLSSYQVLGSGSIMNYVAFTLLTLQNLDELYLTATDCIPLLFNNPPTFQVRTQTNQQVYISRSLLALSRIPMLFQGTNYFTVGKDATALFMDIYLIVLRAFP